MVRVDAPLGSCFHTLDTSLPPEGFHDTLDAPTAESQIQAVSPLLRQVSVPFFVWKPALATTSDFSAVAEAVAEAEAGLA